MVRDLRARTGSGSRTIDALEDGDTPCELELDEAASDLSRGEAGPLRDLVRARGQKLKERRPLPRLRRVLDAERDQDVARRCERGRAELEEVVRSRRERRRDLAGHRE